MGVFVAKQVAQGGLRTVLALLSVGATLGSPGRLVVFEGT